MKYLPGYDIWKGASPMDEVREADVCYFCGFEEDDDRVLCNVYERDINKTVLVCEECIEDIAKGVL